MRRVWVMAAVAAAVVIPAAGGAAGYDGTRPPVAGAVTAVSIRAALGRAEVVIGVDGDIDVQDFSLNAPHRIVIDFSGATLKLPPSLYDGIVRGGISNIRVAQFRANIVRVVLDLDRERDYKVVRGDHEVRVSLETAESFEPWSLDTPAPRAPESARAVVETKPVFTGPASSASSLVPSAQQVPRVSVSFRDTPLLDVLAVFSARSGLSIISGSQQNAAVRITAEIIDVPWDVALNNLLRASGLAVVKDPLSGILVVDSYANLRAQLASEPLSQQVIALNYARAQDLAPTIQSLLSRECSGGGLQIIGAAGGAGAAADAGAAGGGVPPGGAMGGGAVAGAGGPPGLPAQQLNPVAQQQSSCPARGSVTFEVTSNRLIIFEVASRIDALVEYVHSFDFRTPQVNIKAKFVSVNRTDTKRLGVSYDLGSNSAFFNTVAPRSGAATGQEFQVTLGGDSFAGVANASRSFKGAASSAINLIYNTTIGNFSLTSFIDALTMEQLTDVQAEPSINTVDKRPATLFSGQHVAFLLTPPTAAGAIQSAAPQISSLDVGITLTVTPSIAANGMVRLTVLAEQSSDPVVTAAGPNYFKNQASVEVMVRDGETAVIGGLTQTSVSKTRRGIPILGQLPVIGRLFSENENIERKADLLLLITPHILDDVVPPPVPPPGGRN